MTNLEDAKQVKTLQIALHQVFDQPAGKEVIKFLEEICGWYDFSEIDSNMILIKHGKRQVLATIKTLLKLNSEQITHIIKEQ